MYLLSCPFHLPVVRTSSHRFPTHDLSPVHKALAVFRVILIFCTQCGLAISIRYPDVPISAAAVQRGLKADCGEIKVYKYYLYKGIINLFLYQKLLKTRDNVKFSCKVNK